MKLKAARQHIENLSALVPFFDLHIHIKFAKYSPLGK